MRVIGGAFFAVTLLGVLGVTLWFYKSPHSTTVATSNRTGLQTEVDLKNATSIDAASAGPDQLSQRRTGDSTVVTDSLSAIPELVRSAEHIVGPERELLERIADKEVSRFPDDKFIRWAPILIDDKFAFVEAVETNGDITYTPVPTVSITPFAGTTFIAENIRLRDDNHALTWTGDIASGGMGRVSIYLITVSEGEQYLHITIQSDVGAFRIDEIEGTRHAVVTELNRDRKLDDVM